MTSRLSFNAKPLAREACSASNQDRFFHVRIPFISTHLSVLPADKIVREGAEYLKELRHVILQLITEPKRKVILIETSGIALCDAQSHLIRQHLEVVDTFSDNPFPQKLAIRISSVVPLKSLSS